MEVKFCIFANSFTFDRNLKCVGIKRNIDTVRVVEVNESTYYDYVQPACVQQAVQLESVKKLQSQLKTFFKYIMIYMLSFTIQDQT